MIKDRSVKIELRESWNTVLESKKMIQANIVFAFAGGGYVSKTFKDLAYSMTLLFAFSVVEKALIQMRDEGSFSCGSSQLGELMKKSRGSINWIDFDGIDQARVNRNEVAHNHKWIDLHVCLEYLDKIELELVNW